MPQPKPGGVRWNTESNSSVDGLSFANRYFYYRDLYQLYQRGAGQIRPESLAQDFADIDKVTRHYCNAPFGALTAVEIGFGTHPYRLIYFSARGTDVRGIDLDQPLLTGGLNEVFRIACRNGPLRAAKSLARYWLFERQEWEAFWADLATLRPGFTFDATRLIVADAGQPASWDGLGQADVIYSFRVLEHIPPASLAALIQLMHQRLKPNGLCYIVITIHTGLIGGHLPEWYSSQPCDLVRRSEPWEHLRHRRFPADTYLNELTRRDYAALFATRFTILKDEPLWPGLGREFLTDVVRCELPDLDEYELLSNDVLFLLRPRGDDQIARDRIAVVNSGAAAG
jgi:SAM-dependent methyltransferase